MIETLLTLYIWHLVLSALGSIMLLGVVLVLWLVQSTKKANKDWKRFQKGFDK